MAEAAAEKPCREPSGGEAVELKELGDQEQDALRGSELFFDREIGRVRGVRHQAAQRAIRVAGSEVRFEVGRRKGDGRATRRARRPDSVGVRVYPKLYPLVVRNGASWYESGGWLARQKRPDPGSRDELDTRT